MHASDPVNRHMSEAVLSIDVTAPASEILRLFMEYPVHHLPVVDNGKVVGMLSSADLLKLDAFLPKGRARPAGEFLDQRVRIDQLMRKPAITVGASQSVEAAATLMAEHAFHSLPVVDTAGNLVGIITTTDIMAAALHLELHAGRTDAGGELDHVHERLKLLEQVLHAADRYLHAGQDERLHAQLLKAVDEARAHDKPLAALAAS
jgi:CBS domain-containing protein